MPWSIEDDNAECDGYAVVKDEDGEVVGCHATEGEAQDQLTALNIAESERAADVSLTPNAGMAQEARKGLQWVEEGLGGDGLVAATIRDARRMASREALSEAKVRRMPAWFARHAVDMDAPRNADPDNEDYPGPGRVAWALWGGDAGRSWSERVVEQLSEDRQLIGEMPYDMLEDPDEIGDVEDDELEGLSDRQQALYHATEAIAEGYGLFAADAGPEGAHYIAAQDNSFSEQGMACSACAFYYPNVEDPQANGRCEVVQGPEDGLVEPGGLCKLWIIPELNGEEVTQEDRWITNAPVKLEVRESGSSPDELTVRGHAAVFNNLSHDLGGFREQIAPGAFADVLREQPDVHLVIGHDMTMPLARTANGTLELVEDEQGLRIWARINTQLSYAKDLAEQLRTGLVDQMSFAFTTAENGDEWVKDESTGEIMRTVRKVAGLYDVSVVAQGAYPQTDVALIRSALRQHNLLDSSQDIPGALTVAPEQAGGAVASDEGGEQTRSKRLQVMRNTARMALHTHHSKEK
jgi:HK97 family phage prohead protease